METTGNPTRWQDGTMANGEGQPGFDVGGGPGAAGRRTYHVVYVGSLGAAERLSALTAVDKDSFADVMKRAAPEAAVAIKPPSATGPDWEFRLAFDSLRAFEPAVFLSRIAATAAMFEARSAIAQRLAGHIASADLEAHLSALARKSASVDWIPAALRAAGADSSAAGHGSAPTTEGSSILDMVDAPTAPNQVAADIERLVREARQGAPGVSAAESRRLAEILRRLDSELTAAATAVLRDPHVRGLERAWRSLKLLVDRFDFREAVRLSALDAPRDDAVRLFAERVVEPAFNGETPTPGLVVFDYSFENTPADVALLDELAQHAASLPAPVAVQIEPTFFNVKSVALIKNLPELRGLVDQWQFAKWRSLRDKPYSRWILPVVGKFVLRRVHGDGTAGPSATTAGPTGLARPPSGEFTYVEPAASASDLLWANGALAMAVCSARSHARHGWPTRMFGPEAGKLEDLTVVGKPGVSADDVLGPGDALLPDRKALEFVDIGMNLLHAVKGRDFCLLLGGVSAGRPQKKPETTETQARLEVSVPYQQFTSVVSAWLCEQQTGLQGLPADEIQRRLLFGLRELMGLGDDEESEAVMVGVGDSPDQPGRRVVGVRLSPPVRIVPGGLMVEMGFGVS